MTFQAPVDIANRALQHCGASRIIAFTDDSKNATEVSFVYDKVRRAELRRNVWTFATRRSVLRPADVTSMLLTPSAWSASATYLPGSVTQFGGQWFVALKPVPANIEPDLSTNSAYWSQYFGPRMVTPWVFGGVQNIPQPWAIGTSYASGSLVVGSDGYEYNSLVNGNIGHDPVTDGGVHWQKIGQVSTGGGYFAGELVYYPTGPNPGIYVSLNSGNTDIPNSLPAWVGSATYNVGQTVTYSAATWQSNIDLNVNQTPGTNPAAWAIGTTYATGNQVLGSDNNIYSSVGSGNIGHNPVTDTTHTYWTFVAAAAWITVPATQVDQMTGQNWLKLGSATVRSLQFVYPVGSGPLTQEATRNVYVLPYGFLREAPQDPKAGGVSYLGAPSGLTYNDWVFENGVIVTREVNPITFRFVADIADVTLMDDMFCEGMSCRIGMEVCETLTQSTTKLSNIASAYQRFMSEARLVNGIEQQPSESPEDDYVTCRL